MRVLIIKLSAFGDIIHSLSVLDFFREYSERCNRKVELHWLVEERWSPILRNCTGIDNIILTNTKKWRNALFSRATWAEISDFFLKLRNKRYDFVIDINGLLRSAILARLTRSNQRIGFSRDSDFCREGHSAYFLDKTFKVPSGHVVDQTVGLLEKILKMEISKTVIPYLPPDNDKTREAMEFLEHKNLIPKDFALITAGGGWETKLLDEKLIAEFCDCVNQNGIKPVLSWAGDNEKQRADRISSLAKSEVLEIGDLPIDTFIEVLRMSRIVIGPDTGVVHAASAVETATVSYYAPSSAAYSGPRRTSDRVVQISPDCGPCFKRKCDKRICNSLNIRKVLDAIDDELSDRKD